MIMAAVHPAVGNGADFILGEIGGRKAVALGAEPGELFIFIGGYEIAGDGAMAGDGDRTLLREHPVVAEVTGELGGGDGLGLDHDGLPVGCLFKLLYT